MLDSSVALESGLTPEFDDDGFAEDGDILFFLFASQCSEELSILGSAFELVPSDATLSKTDDTSSSSKLLWVIVEATVIWLSFRIT